MTRNEVQICISAIDEASKTFNKVMEGMQSLTSQVALAATKFVMIKAAAETALNGIVAATRPAIDAVREYQEGVIRTAAMITSFQGNQGDLGANYRHAKIYAEGLAQAMEVVDAKTLASAQDLNIITEEMLKQRVVLDVNNQRQLDAFANIANAAAVIAMGYPGKEIQLRQEIRSLMSGQVDQNSQLAQQLNAMTGGSLKEQVALHKKSGDLVEFLGEKLTGYAAASGDIQGLWSTITSSMSTLVNQVLRGGFTPAFKEIVDNSTKMLDWAKQHKEDISQMVNRGWLVMKGIVETVVNLFQPLLFRSESFRIVVDAAFRGLGYIAYAVLPVLAERVGEIFAGMLEWVKLAFNLGKLLWQAFSFDWDGVKATWGDIQKNYTAAGKYASAAFQQGFLDEIGARAADFDRKFNQQNIRVSAPNLGDAPLTEEEKKKLAKRAEELAKLRRELTLEAENAEESNQFDQKLNTLLAKYNEYRKKLTGSEEDQLLLARWYAAEEKKIEDARFDDQLKKAEEARKAEEKQISERIAAAKKAAQEKKAIAEDEINMLLAEIDAQERLGTISKTVAAERKLAAYEKKADVQQGFLDTINRSEDPTGWLSQAKAIQDTRVKIGELRAELRDLSGDFSAGFIQGLADINLQAKSLFQSAREMAKETADAMQSAMSEGFFDIMNGRFNTLGKVLQSFVTAVQRSLANLLAQQATNAIIGKLGGFLGSAAGSGYDVTTGSGYTGEGMFFHKGGLVPRFHFGGLASDEVPAILQTGERVLDRDHNALMERFANRANSSGNVQVNIINQSGQQLEAQQQGQPRFDGEQMVVDVVVKRFKADPAFRNMFAAQGAF